MDSGERGMNPDAMTVINPRKEYWPSRGSYQRPSVLKSATLPTELCGSTQGSNDSNLSSTGRALDFKTRGCGFDSWTRQPNNYQSFLLRLRL